MGGELMDKEILDILKSVQSDIKSMQSDIKSIRTTQEEHTQILRALEHKTDVISAEQENLKYQVAEIKGEVTGIKAEVKGLRKDMSGVEIITANNWSDIAKLKAVK